MKRKHLLLLGLTLGLFLLVACAPDARQSTFGTAGPIAEKQLLLFNTLLWVMVAVFIGVEGVLLYAIIKYRRRPGQDLPPQTHGNTPLEITWSIIPTVLILGLGIWSVFTLFEIDQPPRNADTLDVTVVGHQWWWEFQYHDADGSGKKIVTANELRIPVNRAVSLDLQSADVIHSFWVPKLAGKVDVVPTRNNRMWIQADQTGMFFGQCAEFCGTAHALMKFRVEVLSPDDFNQWVADFGEPPQVSGGAQRGQEIFLDVGKGGCMICHTIDGTPAVGTRGPSLTGLANRSTVGAGLLDLNRENLRRWLRNPAEIKPGNNMAAEAPVYQNTANGDISLSEGDVTALIEYLMTLK
ncbi:MAG: cytochrome c oxidase subunit II [Dehalococcoidia bacterium]